MIENLSLNINDLLTEVMDYMDTEKFATEEQYYEAIDQILEEKQDTGEIPDDVNIQQIRDELRGKWPEVKNQIINQ